MLRRRRRELRRQQQQCADSGDAIFPPFGFLARRARGFRSNRRRLVQSPLAGGGWTQQLEAATVAVERFGGSVGRGRSSTRLAGVGTGSAKAVGARGRG